MEIKNIKNGRYNIHNKLTFDTNFGEINLDSKSALEIAYTLFDCYGMSYAELEKLEEKMEEE